MQKYLAIINNKTAFILVLCLLVTYLCIEYKFSYDLNITLISIAVIFPLVFTIRESFRRRDNLIELLSVFKTSLNAIYYCFADSRKLDDEVKEQAAEKLQAVSMLFLDSLRGQDYNSAMASARVSEIYELIQQNRDKISSSLSLKIIRFIKDVHESMENAMGLKMHGTPISLRAYCLVFIYAFPLVFIPTLVHAMQVDQTWIVYGLSCLHGFILISLFNVQDDMEDPFDQIGLDDIKLDKFEFHKTMRVREPALETDAAIAIAPSIDAIPGELGGRAQ